jgi:hypothetical protein
MKRFAIVFLLLGLFALGTATSGCDSEDSSTYDVTITWDIMGHSTCEPGLITGEKVTVHTIVINIYEKEGDTEPLQPPLEVNDCSNFTTTIPRLDKGTYYVTVDAMVNYHEKNLAFFHNEGSIKAPAETDKGYDFSLEEGKGTVKASWGFDNGKMCGPNGVVTVDISVGDQEPVDCNTGELLIPDLEWGNDYQLTIEGLDAEGTATWSGDYVDGGPFEVLPGETVDAYVLLSQV